MTNESQSRGQESIFFLSMLGLKNSSQREGFGDGRTLYNFPPERQPIENYSRGYLCVPAYCQTKCWAKFSLLHDLFFTVFVYINCHTLLHQISIKTSFKIEMALITIALL